jgi:hypothetical protein
MHKVRTLVVVTGALVTATLLGIQPAAAPPACTQTGSPGADELTGTAGNCLGG